MPIDYSCLICGGGMGREKEELERELDRYMASDAGGWMVVMCEPCGRKVKREVEARGAH